MKIIVIYHSGVGNTKMVAEKIYENLKNDFDAQIYSIEKLPDDFNLNNYDSVVIGFPVIHTEPTRRIMDFIGNIEMLIKPMPTYIFSTCGMYSANTLRIFAKYCLKKNIITMEHSVYRCSATDGSLIAPFMRFWFSHERKLDEKINNDCNNFIRIIKSNDFHLKMPRFKLYSILNYPNKFIGQKTTLTIYPHKNKCIKCGKCILNCSAKALQEDDAGYPVFIKLKCENCYRCIHHCSSKALSLLKRKTPKKLLI